jgi:hypothetical protein
MIIQISLSVNRLARQKNLLHITHLDEVFANLHGVEGSTLANLVAR